MAAPLSPAGSADAAGGAAVAAPPSPVSILLVDDQPGRLLTYRTILEPLGERLVEAASGEEALKRLMDEDFALILLDVNMPGMDGFETATLIHQHPRYENTPIIFVTAVNVGDMDRLRGYKLGAVDYVSVPVIPEILRSKVAVLAELHRKRRELQQANLELQREKRRELERLNAELRDTNAVLAARNAELGREVAERALAEGRLREADRRKDAFLATLAHELRNPLAPLQNALSIRRLEADGAGDPMLAMMERQLALLVRLIDDLLDVARISSGKLALREAPTTLAEVLDAAIETAAPQLDAGGHALQAELPDREVPLRADRDRLAQVFANLLNNAAKYSDDGTPVSLRAALGDGEVLVRVRDHGIGLAEEQLDAIFERFAQAEHGRARSQGGLGIGLTLVRQLVRMHGGEVSARSAGLGHGSEFTVRLPCRPSAASGPGESAAATPAPATSAPAPAAPGQAASPPLRALVVDDNHDAADSLAMMLEMLGHEVRRLYGPEEVAAVVGEFEPELVFLDVGMPGTSGHALARQLRATPTGARLRLVAVTGWGQPDDLRRSEEAGFDMHLVKPPALDAIMSICADAAARAAGGA